MRAPLRPLLVLVAASGLAACDFTPTLDIETPEYVAGVAVRGFLAADSVATLWVTESFDPYEGRPPRTNSPADQIAAAVTLLRGGAIVDRLTERRDRCIDDMQPPVPPGGEIETYPCGPYVGTTPIEAGATYTVRVEAEGLPTAEATVTVPRRPTLTGVEETVGADGPRRLRVRLGDPGGLGDLYGLSLLRIDRYPIEQCGPDGCTTVGETSFRSITAFETSDPVLVAAAREFDGTITFAAFPDETFDGEEKAFAVSPSSRYSSDDRNKELVVQVAALSGDVYDAYLIEYTSGGDDNPFAEPVNLPSNVEGGYGLVGGIALAEVAFDARGE